jgi:hypothetical protein
MKFFSGKVLFSLASVVLCAFVLSGCGVTDGKLNDANQRIDKLVKQGAPDSVVESAKMLVLNIRSALKYGGSIDPQKQYDSLIAMLDKTEVAYAHTTNSLKPVIMEQRTGFDAKLQALTGMQHIEAQKIIGKLDSLINANKWPEAQKQCALADTALQSLVIDEQRAQAIKPKLAGTWTGSEHITENGANAMEKTVFVFGKDGTADVTEEHKGVNSETNKSEWKFHSTGTYDVKGDTAFLAITHEQCLKQIFWNLTDKGGKTVWDKSEMPTYDSTITSGKKNRFVTFTQLSKTYKKR